MKEVIAYKFVKWEVDPLENFKNSFAYKLKQKIINGGKMTRQEKDKLYDEIAHNSYSKTGIPLGGWMFDFRHILKEYFIEYDHGHIQKVYAPDKMSIRNNLYESSIKRIIEVS